MSYKKRPKNKQEIESFSGSKHRAPDKKIKITFQFTDKQGNTHRPPQGRLKINADCGVSCLILQNDKWFPVKAHLDFIRKKR